MICSEGVEGKEGRKLERGNLIPKDPSIPQTLKFAEDLYELYEFKDVEELTEDSFFIKKVEKVMILCRFLLFSHQLNLITWLNKCILR